MVSVLPILFSSLWLCFAKSKNNCNVNLVYAGVNMKGVCSPCVNGLIEHVFSYLSDLTYSKTTVVLKKRMPVKLNEGLDTSETSEHNFSH